MAFEMTSHAPPTCAAHEEQMVISAHCITGVNWVCLSCVREVAKTLRGSGDEQAKKDYANTRWPEGAEI